MVSVNWDRVFESIQDDVGRNISEDVKEKLQSEWKLVPIEPMEDSVKALLKKVTRPYHKAGCSVWQVGNCPYCISQPEPLDNCPHCDCGLREVSDLLGE